MDSLILGIDDAGRGPVIGPMVLAGCLINKETEREFRRLGVKDSKQLTQRRRDFLESTIKEKSKGFKVVLVQPDEIDKSNGEGIKLNELEAIANGFKGVSNSYAIQAGRELRVIVESGTISDDDSIMLSKDIVKKIEELLTFPGQIRVTVIRETRAVEYANK